MTSLVRDNMLALLVSFILMGSAFFSPVCFGQNTTEIGGGIGGLNYRGEVSPRYRVLNNRPAFTVFFRKDISAPITLRAAITLGGIKAKDLNVKRNGQPIPIAARRQAEFSAFLTELMIGAEYNFLDYYDQKRRTRWSPYLFLGLAGYYANTSTVFNTGLVGSRSTDRISNSKLSLAVPVGVGLKYALSYTLNLGLEVGARRTFGDRFDNLTEEEFPQSAQPYDPDWYFYNGISLSYTFYTIRCPAFYKGQAGRLLR